jgi:glycosyltransferase involved in cell wall biosynthesis
MHATSLSVVMPVINEARNLPRTLESLTAALDDSGFDADLIVVDDGSTDGSGKIARDTVNGRIPVRVLRQANSGRFEARRRGLEVADGRFVLFLDARVRLDRDALRFVYERLADMQAWNGHVRIETDNPFGIFWRLLAELAWRDYFDDPRTTSYGAAEFDRFPKGTTCFLAPRELLVAAFDRFDPQYRDVRMANDDTPILRALAERQRISVSPAFACVYEPRSSLVGFLRHSFRRGTVFVDGHGVRESRFFPAVVAFFPLSAALMVAALRRPWLAPAALVACGTAAAAYGMRAKRTSREVATLAAVTPLYALGHGLGMWRGLAEITRNRMRS